MLLKRAFWIAAGGVCGVLARYAMGLSIGRALDSRSAIPVGTLCVNLTGCFLAGLAYSALPEGDLRAAILVGALGGFTTFSAFSVETLLLLDNGRALASVAYLGLSVLGGLAAAYAGLVAGRGLAS